MQHSNSHFSSFLDSMEQVNNFKGGVIVNKKGTIVADNFKDFSRAEQIAALTSDTLNNTIGFTREGRTGRFRNILLEGSFGKIYVIALNTSGYYAAITGTKGMNIGMINAIFAELTSDIDKIKS